MTDEETDAGVGRLARRYADIKREIACVQGRIDEAREAAESSSSELRYLHAKDYAKIKARFDAVPWADISGWLEKLVDMGEEKKSLEGYLRDAGLGDLIK